MKNYINRISIFLCNRMRWVIITILIRIGVFAIHIASDKISHKFDPLKKKEYIFKSTDTVCLSINMIVETLFTYWIYQFTCGMRLISKLSCLNVALLFIFDDLLYAPYHHILHTRRFFKWIHFRHHRITHPHKSYIHASMEHPFEMLGALLLHASVIYIFYPILDRFSVICHLFLKALGACLNHSGKDVNCLVYETKLHHIHHMQRTCNYAQYVFIYDRLIGTLRT